LTGRLIRNPGQARLGDVDATLRIGFRCRINLPNPSADALLGEQLRPLISPLNFAADKVGKTHFDNSNRLTRRPTICIAVSRD
jgi:hypothetical protein